MPLLNQFIRHKHIPKLISLNLRRALDVGNYRIIAQSLYREWEIHI